MGKLDKYKIDLKGMQVDSAEYEFDLDNSFFADIDAPEVQRGKVKAVLSVHKNSQTFDLNFKTEGFVWVLCDRCLDDMEQPVASEDTLVVKFGEDYSDEGENLIVVPEDEGVINVAWFLYEFIALAIPMKHVHAPGKCNREMEQKLSRHLRVLADDEEADFDRDADEATDGEGTEGEDKPIDPRWNELKKILDNN